MPLRPAALAGVDRAWRLAADVRRRWSSAADTTALAQVLGDADRREPASWRTATEAAQLRLRESFPEIGETTAIVCVSMRPEHLRSVVDHVRRQRLGGLAIDPDVVFVANSPGFDDAAMQAAFSDVPRCRIINNGESVPLGAALNLGLDATDARFVAKFDDDDRYGPFHLADSVRVHSFAGAGVVGKHTYLAHVEDTGQSLMRFPGHEFETSGTLAGGSLVIDRDRTGDLVFEEISLGEDRAFLRACHRRGISTFSGDRFNFVQVRHGANTWQMDDSAFADESFTVDEDELERALQ